MTFKEAFNSGCRFKLPCDFGERYSWPKEFWWVKEDKNKVRILYNTHTDRTYTVRSLKKDRELDIDLKSNQWFLHPEDEQKMKFNKKFEEVINK